ncbi:pyridine nucleotide-disulfide oxidoreductase [Paenibacillus sp. FSL R7-0273]|uniref:NAD(P)/FAD-dependent oxidoreductase n=1 Tax=Paenibacillus sp. FSL R7-0273 TaxID=1536772 RepID=UPI0004F7684C|nr:NAD(P)/FAD-dependent oxidoreductase [Paenibacillus sp. FSL R7-0273]AIQ47157.1 pyridine nucleotide-disulfide oxidoreductase [Paenibacillus sp. FSL R7-0273]OMF97087.1 pyridine nucleotide-disulfide oxidoreductase [Paenibacillus sp. FSL R7-0273]
MNKKADVVIIGGGPAGLNAALVLGRARKSVIVIDDLQPRNIVTRETHGFLTRDGASPREFRKAAHEELAAYPSVSRVSDTASAVTGKDGAFEITTASGAVYLGKKLLFAVGKKDLPLSVDGLAEVYGKSAFVCPYCDGWELRDKKLVLIVTGAHALHLAKVISGWTKDYSICTNGPAELSGEERGELAQHGVLVHEAAIETIESEEGMVRQVILADGTRLPCEGIFFAPKLTRGSDLPQALGCEMNEVGSVVIDDYGKTNIPGVFSAGDAASEKYQAIAAAASGALTAIMINGELNGEAWDASVSVE